MSQAACDSLRDAGPVRDLMLQRRQTASRAGLRDDGAVLALVAEGGGMRGVVIGGMVSALERLGMLDAFDILCGTSSGAFACAYFGAGQAAMGTRIYAEDLCDGRFIGLHRGAFGHPIMKLDYLVDEVIVETKPLDTGALLNRSVSLVITTTEVATGRPHSLRNFPDGTAVRNALRASSRVPMVAGPPVVIEGRALLDGAATSPLPLSAAVAAGATHILALTSLPASAAYIKQPDWVARSTARFLRCVYGTPLSKAYLGSITEYARSRDALRVGGLLDGQGRHIPILGISPKNGLVVGRLCRNRRLLGMGAQGGYDSIVTDLGFSDTIKDSLSKN